jgi:predicted MFS family arabinose efflux permease
MTPIEGVEDISRRANQWYDPNVVDALRELHGLKPLDVVDRPEVPRRITTLRVLRANPGFSSLITAIGISAIGDPLTTVATLVTIYLRTRDPRFVALALGLQAAATILVTAGLGGMVDRVPRRVLLVGFELFRAAILVAVAFLLPMNWWLIFPAVFALASINALVQPTRQAAIPSVVPAGHPGKANAMVVATTMSANAVGFGVAGAVLSLYPNSPTVLFIVDAATFVVAAALVVGIRSLGGGAATMALTGASRRAWRIVAARPQLVIGGLAALLIPISFPALLTLAYVHGGNTYGGQIYSTLELILSLGLFIGSVAVGRLSSIGTFRTVGIGLLLTGAFSVAIAVSPSLQFAAVALFIASFGNPVYAVANQTAVMQTSDSRTIGSLMATRFGIVQTASIIGVGVGGVITEQLGAQAAYAVLGIGLVMLALYALAAGRSTVNRLHGEAYEAAHSGASSNGSDLHAPQSSSDGRESNAIRSVSQNGHEVEHLQETKT